MTQCSLSSSIGFEAPAPGTVPGTCGALNQCLQNRILGGAGVHGEPVRWAEDERGPAGPRSAPPGPRRAPARARCPDPARRGREGPAEAESAAVEAGGSRAAPGHGSQILARRGKKRRVVHKGPGARREEGGDSPLGCATASRPTLPGRGSVPGPRSPSLLGARASRAPGSFPWLCIPRHRPLSSPHLGGLSSSFSRKAAAARRGGELGAQLEAAEGVSPAWGRGPGAGYHSSAFGVTGAPRSGPAPCLPNE